MAREFGVDPFGQFGDGGVQVVQREEPLVAQSRDVPKARLRPHRAEGASSTATIQRSAIRTVPSTFAHVIVLEPMAHNGSLFGLARK
jgi:hypothetical protein